MPKYIVIVREVNAVTYEIEAKNEEEAVRIVNYDTPNPVDTDTTDSEIVSVKED